GHGGDDIFRGLEGESWRSFDEIGRVLIGRLQRFTILSARPLAEDSYTQFFVAKQAIDRLAVGHQEPFHGFSIFLYGRTSRNEARGWVVDAFFCEVREHDKAGFLSSKVSGRCENTPLDDSRLHARDDFRLAAHLENFYVSIRLQAIFFQIRAQTDIGGSSVAGNSEGFAFQVLI